MLLWETLEVASTPIKLNISQASTRTVSQGWIISKIAEDYDLKTRVRNRSIDSITPRYGPPRPHHRLWSFPLLFEPFIRSTPIGLQSLLGRLPVCTFEAEVSSFLVYKLQSRIIEKPSSL